MMFVWFVLFVAITIMSLFKTLFLNTPTHDRLAVPVAEGRY